MHSAFLKLVCAYTAKILAQPEKIAQIYLQYLHAFPSLLEIWLPLPTVSCQNSQSHHWPLSHCDINIARIANAVHCHSSLSGHKDCHEFRFPIVRIVINVSKATIFQDYNCHCQNCQNCKNCQSCHYQKWSIFFQIVKHCQAGWDKIPSQTEQKLSAPLMVFFK